MFTLVIMINLSNQTQPTKTMAKKQENHPQDYLQVEVISLSLLTVVSILKLVMCILATMISHFSLILITKMITTTNPDNLQLVFHQVDLTRMNQMIQDLTLKLNMFILATMIDLFNPILIIKINLNTEILSHKGQVQQEWLIIVLPLIIRKQML